MVHIQAHSSAKLAQDNAQTSTWLQGNMSDALVGAVGPIRESSSRHSTFGTKKHMDTVNAVPTRKRHTIDSSACP